MTLKQTILIALVLGVMGCNERIERETQDDCAPLTESRGCIVTYVWNDNDKIVWASYLNINASQHQIDSVKAKADSILKHIKSL